MKKTIIASLLVAAVSSQAAMFTFLENGSNVALGSSSTFTSGGYSITAYAGAGDTLYAKDLGGSETGLGLLSDPSGQHEITPGHFIQLGLPLTPAATLDLLFLNSIQTVPVESATIWYSTTLGALGTQIGTVYGDANEQGTFDVSAYSTGYIGVSAGDYNILIAGLSTGARTPDGGSSMILLGSALTAAGLIRRKLVA